MAATADKSYVCQLDAKTAEKAKKELNEDPKDRMNALNALRTWIDQQPHITFDTSTLNLLGFLRTAKFSQLRARTLIENYTKAVTNNPVWFRNVDTHDPDTLAAVDSGYIVLLPKRDKNGCRILLYRLGATNKDGEGMTVVQDVHLAWVLAAYCGMDENVQVNGYNFIIDWTGFSMKHMLRWNMDDMKNWNACWQNAMPGHSKDSTTTTQGHYSKPLWPCSNPC